MKLNDKIDIDILEFLKTGKFDYIKLGQTKEWILNNFTAPEDFANGNSIEKANIWRYGNIEFYFNDKQKLWMIFNASCTLLACSPRTYKEEYGLCFKDWKKSQRLSYQQLPRFTNYCLNDYRNVTYSGLHN